MPKYAIAFINFYDNANEITFINAENEKEAISRHAQLEWLADDEAFDSASIEDLKSEAFNADEAFDIKEIPE